MADKDFAKKAGPKIVQVVGQKGEQLNEKNLPLLKFAQLKLGDIKRGAGYDELRKYSVFLSNFIAGSIRDVRPPPTPKKEKNFF